MDVVVTDVFVNIDGGDVWILLKHPETRRYSKKRNSTCDNPKVIIPFHAF